MVWLKVDDRFHAHPKVQKLIKLRTKEGRRVDSGPLALWVLAGSWCGQARTDGFVPDYLIDDFSGNAADDARRLVEVGLWQVVVVDGEDGYQFHDWVDHNPTRDEQDLGDWKKRRKDEVHRDKDLKNAVVDRDGSACRYCRRTVKWEARNGLAAATFDHVDPEGPNNLKNVVVACKGCNDEKGRRTPEEWGHELLPAPRGRRRAGGPARQQNSGAERSRT